MGLGACILCGPYCVEGMTSPGEVAVARDLYFGWKKINARDLQGRVLESFWATKERGVKFSEEKIQ